MAIELNNHIKMLGTREHAKASEAYVDVIFTYGDKQEHLSIPIVYRRTGIKLGGNKARKKSKVDCGSKSLLGRRAKRRSNKIFLRCPMRF